MDFCCLLFAHKGDLQGLRDAHERGCPWDAETCSNAAFGGHLECLRYAHEQGCPWDAWTCADAAQNVQRACFVYARERGCPWDPPPGFRSEAVAAAEAELARRRDAAVAIQRAYRRCMT